MPSTLLNNKAGKDRREQKGDKRKAIEQIRRIQDEKRKLEKEKEDYERQKAEEVNKINEVKSQLDARPDQLQGEYEELLRKQNAADNKAPNLKKMLQETKDKENALGNMERENEEGGSGGNRAPQDEEDLFTLEETMREMGVSDDETVIG